MYKILILGCGKMPADCAQIVFKTHQSGVSVIETRQVSFSNLKATCVRLGIPYLQINKSNLVSAYLEKIADPTLVLSINNEYIMPRDILANKNIRCVNFHGSLLPQYPGHGDVIPSWVIFNGESAHGGTWHIIREVIDMGAIICQRSFDVAKTDTAIGLMMRVIKVGIELFSEHWQSFWIQSQQTGVRDGSFTHTYRRRDLPNNGVFDTAWDFYSAERFLRSMDTRPLNFLPGPKLTYEGRYFSIESYRVCRDLIKELPGFQMLPKERNQRFFALFASPEGSIELELKLEPNANFFSAS